MLDYKTLYEDYLFILVILINTKNIIFDNTSNINFYIYKNILTNSNTKTIFSLAILYMPKVKEF
jgi:hypothetical protein